MKNSIFATEKFKMRCETLIIIFYLYKKIKHWNSIGILGFQCFFIHQTETYHHVTLSDL